MAATDQQELKLDAIESDDGSAVVEVDPKLLTPDEIDEQNGFDLAKDGGSAGDSADDDHPDDDADLREAKRNRRRAKKDLIRKTNQEKDARLQQLQRENEEFRRRLEGLERNTKTEGLMRIDKNIEDAQTKIEYAKMKIAEATQNQDGNAMVEAQELLVQANDEIRQLSNMRRQADNELKNQHQGNQQNSAVQENAREWMRRNRWYNPEGRDSDSIVAKKMDELMAAQGWDPTDPDYFEELDSRLQKELPHRYNSGNDDDSRNVRRPRNVVASSGREASAAYGGSNRSQFILSPERVKAMKEAGAWDNPVRKQKMIQQFMAYDRANRNN